jgi:hypothetical protein
VTLLRPRAGRLRDAVLLGGLLLLLAAVAITAGMARPAAGSSAPPVVPLAALLGWGAVAAVLGGVLLAAGMKLWSNREKVIAVLLFLAFIAGFGILAERSRVPAVPILQLQTERLQPTAPPPPPASPRSSQAPPPARVVPRTTAPHGGAGVPAWAIALAGAGAVLLAVLLLRAPSRRDTLPGRARDALDAAVAESMQRMESESDPRRAIIAAWLAMADALGRHGLRRQAWEAPLEYMRRALHAVQVSQASAQRLTALFQWARYSDHPATAAMRDDALRALQSVRDDLGVGTT